MKYLKLSLLVALFLWAMPSISKAQDDENIIVSAFFGLDNALPMPVNAICPGGTGQDGMPVNFKYMIDGSTLEASDFEVIDEAGNTHTPLCAVLAPANENGENRTVLLVGEFGNDGTNPPAEIRIIGELLTLANTLEQSACSKVINLNGQSTQNVVPLSEGPKLFFAQRIEGAIAECSSDRQVIQVAWNGGVVPFQEGDTEADLFQYYTAYTENNGVLTPHQAISIADINDNDNFHQLCFEVSDSIVKIEMQANVVEDPNGDPNPFTEIEVSYCEETITSLESENSSKINIFPNPSHDYFKIESENLQGKLLIQIYNLSGKMLLEQNIEAKELLSQNFDISSFPSGTYLLQITRESTVAFSKLMVLR